MKDANEITKIKATLGVIQHDLNGMSSDDSEKQINCMLMLCDVMRELTNVVNAIDIALSAHLPA